jgi:hypothetical protein
LNVKIDANQDMLTRMDANQTEMKAGTKADQARMEANKEEMLAEISAKLNTSHKITMAIMKGQGPGLEHREHGLQGKPKENGIS